VVVERAIDDRLVGDPSIELGSIVTVRQLGEDAHGLGAIPNQPAERGIVGGQGGLGAGVEVVGL
jgi:hypothetical protein